jgi:LL-diaminopimelate aminotransferase
MEIGLLPFQSPATFYIWAHTPKGIDSLKYSNLLLEKADIVATPGLGFGSEGDDYLRFSLTTPTDRIKEATERMKEIQF